MKNNKANSFFILLCLKTDGVVLRGQNAVSTFLPHLASPAGEGPGMTLMAYRGGSGLTIRGWCLKKFARQMI